MSRGGVSKSRGEGSVNLGKGGVEYVQEVLTARYWHLVAAAKTLQSISSIY